MNNLPSTFLILSKNTN